MISCFYGTKRSVVTLKILTPVNGRISIRFAKQDMMFRNSLIVRIFDPYRKALIHWIHDIHSNRLEGSARSPVNIIISTKRRITTIKATANREILSLIITSHANFQKRGIAAKMNKRSPRASIIFLLVSSDQRLTHSGIHYFAEYPRDMTDGLFG